MLSERGFQAVLCVTLAAAVFCTGAAMLIPRSAAVEETSKYASELFLGDGILAIDIQADAGNWRQMLDSALEKEYIPCDITVNGQTIQSAGIRPKGNSSLSSVANSDSDRYGLKIEFDHYISGQTLLGLDKLTLSNMFSDATYMKEYLSYRLFASVGVAAPLCAFAQVTVNGENWGFFLAVEGVEESFALRNYGADYGPLYKPDNLEIGGLNNRNDATGQFEGRGGGQGGIQKWNQGKTGIPRETDEYGAKQPPGADMPDMRGNIGGFGNMGGDSSAAGLNYIGEDPDSYSVIFDGAVFDITNADKSRLINALKDLNDGANLKECVDVDSVLAYIAANAMVVNLDSIFGTMYHNYYLYEKDGQLSIVPWDYNLAFGSFQSGSANTAVNLPIDTPVSGGDLSDRPIIAKLLQNEEYLERYHQILYRMATDWAKSFSAEIDRLDALIGEYVKNDPSAFYTYDEYVAQIEELKKFGALRAQSVLGQLDGSIPSTAEGQTANPDALVDASGLTLRSMGGREGHANQNGGQNFGRNRQDNNAQDRMPGETQDDAQTGDMPDNAQGMPDARQGGTPQGPWNNAQGGMDLGAENGMAPQAQGFIVNRQTAVMAGCSFAALLFALPLLRFYPKRRYVSPAPARK